jgi:hypothetical protein
MTWNAWPHLGHFTFCPTSRGLDVLRAARHLGQATLVANMNGAFICRRVHKASQTVHYTIPVKGPPPQGKSRPSAAGGELPQGAGSVENAERLGASRCENTEPKWERGKSQRLGGKRRGGGCGGSGGRIFARAVRPPAGGRALPVQSICARGVRVSDAGGRFVARAVFLCTEGVSSAMQ